MAKIAQFEDLIAWQKARELTRRIYLATQGSGFSRDFALRDQMRRASVSVMSNVAEGFERNRRGEFHQFLSMAKASCAEVRSHLYVCLDAGYLQRDEVESLLDAAVEVGRIIGGLRASLRLETSRAKPLEPAASTSGP